MSSEQVKVHYLDIKDLANIVDVEVDANWENGRTIIYVDYKDNDGTEMEEFPEYHWEIPNGSKEIVLSLRTAYEILKAVDSTSVINLIGNRERLDKIDLQNFAVWMAAWFTILSRRKRFSRALTLEGLENNFNQLFKNCLANGCSDEDKNNFENMVKAQVAVFEQGYLDFPDVTPLTSDEKDFFNKNGWIKRDSTVFFPVGHTFYGIKNIADEDIPLVAKFIKNCLSNSVDCKVKACKCHGNTKQALQLFIESLKR